MEPHKIWIRDCKTARRIEDKFGTQKALKYLVEENLLNFLQAAEYDPAFRAEIPAFVAEVKTIFEPWQLRECLEQARQTEPFDPTLCDDPEEAEMEKEFDLHRRTADRLLVAQARQWLLEENGE